MRLIESKTCLTSLIKNQIRSVLVLERRFNGNALKRDLGRHPIGSSNANVMFTSPVGRASIGIVTIAESKSHCEKEGAIASDGIKEIKIGRASCRERVLMPG